MNLNAETDDPYMPAKIFRVRKVGIIRKRSSVVPPASKTFGDLMWAWNHLKKLKWSGAEESEIWVGTTTWRKMTEAEIKKELGEN